MKYDTVHAVLDPAVLIMLSTLKIVGIVPVLLHKARTVHAYLKHFEKTF